MLVLESRTPDHSTRVNIKAAHLSITIIAALVCGLLAGSAIAAPTDSDFAHVVELAAGTYTKTAVDSRIAAAGTGSVLIRPAPGATVTIQWGGAQGSPAAMSRQGLYYYGMNFTGNVGMTQGSTFDTMISSDAAPGMFQSSGPGGFTVRNSVLSGGRGTKQGQGCEGNVFSQMTFSGDDGVTLEGNTFRNFANRAGSDCGPDHSEALYLGESISNWVIRNNTFTNNGSTGHIFFTWWYCGGGYASRCAHQNVCIEGNDFGPTWGAYFDIDARTEFPDSMSVYIDPAQNAGLATKAQAWERPCPGTTPPPLGSSPPPPPTPPPAQPLEAPVLLP